MNGVSIRYLRKKNGLSDITMVDVSREFAEYYLKVMIPELQKNISPNTAVLIQESDE